MTGGSGKWAKITGCTINVQDSSVALETKSLYKHVLLSDMTAQGAGITRNYLLDPVDDNKIWQVVHLHLWAEIIAGSTGVHEWYLSHSNFDNILWFRANSTVAVGWVRGDSIGTTTIITPATDAGRQRLLADGLYATHAVPLIISYGNGSNLTQNTGRMIEAMVIESYIDNI